MNSILSLIMLVGSLLCVSEKANAGNRETEAYGGQMSSVEILEQRIEQLCRDAYEVGYEAGYNEGYHAAMTKCIADLDQILND